MKERNCRIETERKFVGIKRSVQFVEEPNCEMRDWFWVVWLISRQISYAFFFFFSFFFLKFFVSLNDSSINGVRLIFTLGLICCLSIVEGLICYFHFNPKKKNFVTFKIIGIFRLFINYIGFKVKFFINFIFFFYIKEVGQKTRFNWRTNEFFVGSR